MTLGVRNDIGVNRRTHRGPVRVEESCEVAARAIIHDAELLRPALENIVVNRPEGAHQTCGYSIWSCSFLACISVCDIMCR